MFVRGKAILRNSVAVGGLAIAHFVATLGSLVLATAVSGDIDAPHSPASTAGGASFFQAFRVLNQPLGRFWLQTDALPMLAFRWMALNGALWALVLVALFHGVRSVRKLPRDGGASLKS